jgi:predicted hydrolase (HD superfamily)
MAKNYKRDQVLEAVQNSAGVMEYVAHRLGCSWDTARTYVNKWAETREAFAVSECKLHTLAYKSFHKAIANGERWAVERILDTTARRNGHNIITRHEIDHTSAGEKLEPTRIIFERAPQDGQHGSS